MNNLQAFADTVAWSEGTTRPELVGASDNGYNVLIGSTAAQPLFFTSYDTHPDIYNPRFNSTAAGKYQIIFPTWHALTIRLGLTDFGPPTQEAMFESLVTVDCGALDAINAGQFIEALMLCSGQWASLPSSNVEQNQNQIDALMKVYQGLGGVIST